MTMFSRLTDFDRTFDVLDELRRQMDRVWNDYDGTVGTSAAAAQPLSSSSFPRFDVTDAGANLVVTADVPGMTDKDLQVSLEGGVLTVAGERKADTPEGYTAHRRERGAFKFTRSLALPIKVDGDKTSATVKDGVLAITLSKAPEARPRQIAVRAQS